MAVSCVSRSSCHVLRVGIGGLALAASCLVAACGGSPSRTDRAAETGTQQVPDAECDPAPIQQGNLPEWTLGAGMPPDSRFAVATGEEVAAFFFTDRLRSGNADSRRNKILWTIAPAADPATMKITARSAAASQPIAITADSGGGSGEVQRSIAVFPAPGCWRLDMRWKSRSATLDVAVTGPASS